MGNNTMKYAYLSIILLLAAMGANALEIVIIANSQNTNSLSRETIAQIYTGNKSTWPDGSRIVACDQKMESQAAKAFLSVYPRKSTADYQALWMEKMLSGAANPPKSLGSDNDVIEFVASNKGAIGYVAKESVTGKVKDVTPR